jgi:hypothetical protein
LNRYQWDINRIWFSIKVLNKYQNKSKTKNTQTNKEKTKQNVNNKNKAKIIIHTDFQGYSKCRKNILWLFFVWLFFYRRNTYLRYYIEHRHYFNINSIQSMISVKFSKKKRKQFGKLFSWTDFAIQLRCCWTQA